MVSNALLSFANTTASRGLSRAAWLGLSAGLVLFLSACASRPPQPVYTNPNLPAHWEAEGKAAVRSKDRGGNVYFTWTQRGDDYHIILRGPLGLGRAELTGTPGEVTLTADNIEKVSAGSLEEIVQTVTRRHAPVSNILHWIKAEPATPGAEINRDANGKISQIIEDGWTVNYIEWSAEAPNLPRKLTLAGPDGQATVIIGQWRLNLAADTP
jgi:outer membrane lipoprotein LolB